MRRTAVLCLMVLFALTATTASASEAARITGKVIDAQTKAAIPDATVTVKAVEGKNFQQEFKANKKDGSYAVYLLTGTIKYEFTYAAPGYAPYKEVMKLKIGEPNVKDVELSKGAVVTVGGGEIKIDPNVAAYNDGAALANSGDHAGAIKKFEEALAAKPDMTAAWQALAKLSLRTKNYTRAIEAANKALEGDPEDVDMFIVLYDSYLEKGDKAKAAEYKSKLPANAGALFNDAAKAINAGNDAAAEPLLKQAIELDEKFGKAHYELGMLYVRSGKNADAKASLQKYLEIEPTGSDAATAKEMLKYVQ